MSKQFFILLIIMTTRTPAGQNPLDENPDITQDGANTTINLMDPNVVNNSDPTIPTPVSSAAPMPLFIPQATVVKHRYPIPNQGLPSVVNDPPPNVNQFYNPRFQFPPPQPFPQFSNSDFKMDQLMMAISELAGTQKWIVEKFNTLENKVDSLTPQDRSSQNPNIGKRLVYSSNSSINSQTGAVRKTTFNPNLDQNTVLNTNAPVFTPRIQNSQPGEVVDQNPSASQFSFPNFQNQQVTQGFPSENHQSQGNNLQSHYTEVISSSPEIVNPEVRIRRTTSTSVEKISDRVRVDKWGLFFDGRSGLSISEFIFRLETMQRLYKYPWGEIMRDFTTFLSGDALKCYWKFVKSNSELSWPKLKDAFHHRFGSRKLDLDIWREMTDRKQGPKEKFVDFYDAIIDLRGKLSKDLPDSEIIKLIKQNSSRFIRNMVYPQSIGSIEELFEACLEVETTFSQYDESKRQQSNQPSFKPTNKHVYAINDSGELEEEVEFVEVENIAALDFQKRNQNQGFKRPNQIPNQNQKQHSHQQISNQPPNHNTNFQCFNCKQFGHGFFNCPYPQKEIFCFRCGMANCTLPQCPNCNSGNGQSRVKDRANSRSIQTQTSQPTNTQVENP